MNLFAPARSTRKPASSLARVLAMLLLPAFCTPSNGDPVPPDTSPNFLWVLWDTVRSDRLSLYGHAMPTTPFVAEWSKGGRVFDNCVSVASTTVPAHASMFTGLMPSEHRADVGTRKSLASRHKTVAELLGGKGYQTYLFSANPSVDRSHGLVQGFDVAEHPWDKKYAAALRLAQQKAAEADGAPAKPEGRQKRRSHWSFKRACGVLAQRGVEEWLASCDGHRPFFIFLNYMEAHTPRHAPQACSRRVMPAEMVSESYKVSVPTWRYIFGQTEASEEELALIAAKYDATLAELDDLFRSLLNSLEAGGYLDNTVVILTADHGEHLGEHHLLNHQYSVYNPLLNVPLVIHYPPRFEPGRDRRPVMNLDLFCTVLELAGVDLPEGLKTRAVSLLDPPAARTRLAEYRNPLAWPMGEVQRTHPTVNLAPFRRSLRALLVDRYKYIWASDGSYELYDVVADPREVNNLIRSKPQLAAELDRELQAAVTRFQAPDERPQPSSPLTEEQRRRLQALGYLGGSEDADDQ